jgi:hypothetical protein
MGTALVPWVNSSRRHRLRSTSTFSGKADEIGEKPDISQLVASVLAAVEREAESAGGLRPGTVNPGQPDLFPEAPKIPPEPEIAMPGPPAGPLARLVQGLPGHDHFHAEAS